MGGEAREAAARLIADLDRAAADVPRLRTGEVLYRYLQASGLLARLAKESQRGGRGAGQEHLAVLRRREGATATTPSTTGARVRRPPRPAARGGRRPRGGGGRSRRRRGSRPHRAQGEGARVPGRVPRRRRRADAFPCKARRDPLELPADLLPEAAAVGDAHHQEERRLFYVAMTRAKDELVMTSAADYGTARARKVSRFVRGGARPALARAARRARARPWRRWRAISPRPEGEPGPEPPLPDSEVLPLSFRQIDDYQTCPLKYKYVHRLRVPLLIHHRIVYGHAIHKAVQEHFRARADGRPVRRGGPRRRVPRRLGLGRFPLPRPRGAAAGRRGRRAAPLLPAGAGRSPAPRPAIEEDFTFFVDRTRVQGRYDLVVESGGAITILDFKTGVVDSAGGRGQAREGQPAARRLRAGPPARQGTAAGPRGAALPRIRPRRRQASHAPSRRRPRSRPSARSARSSAGASSRAKPSYLACGQCAFRDICPHTARGPEADEPIIPSP